MTHVPRSLRRLAAVRKQVARMNEGSRIIRAELERNNQDGTVFDNSGYYERSWSETEHVMARKAGF
ncbi:hypothetical protein [Subtercola sp. YIM 133946]|uniref:hypothetical protein n=1 Tax=Subtercola sp. YIM 133946 TaxID=3118909 RepID=UPI002F9200F8